VKPHGYGAKTPALTTERLAIDQSRSPYYHRMYVAWRFLRSMAGILADGG
jgi:hypothetical protein